MCSAGLPGRSGVGAPLPNPTGQSPRAVVPVSIARAEASCRNGAEFLRAEDPRRRARRRMRMRGQKYVKMPNEPEARPPRHPWLPNEPEPRPIRAAPH